MKTQKLEFTKEYRVKKKGDIYRPQIKRWYGWDTITVFTGYDCIKIECSSYEEALKKIEQHKKFNTKNKEVKILSINKLRRK